MTDSFSDLISTARSFFGELALNNTKEWFEPRKDVYQNEIRKPAELLAQLMAEEIGRLTGVIHRAKVYRIHRDVRFSKDKSPYNAHLHMLWSPAGEGVAPGWFFAVSPEYVQFATGIMDFGPSIDRFRQFVDRHGDDLVEAMTSAPAARLEDWGSEALKRVPKPFEETHPHAELLKCKNLILSVHLQDGWDQSGVLDGLRAKAETLLPFWRLLHEEMQ